MATFTADTSMVIKFIFLAIILTQNLYAQTGIQEIISKYPKQHQEILQRLEEDETIDGEKISQDLKKMYFEEYLKTSNAFLESDVLDSENELLKNILENLEHNEEEVEQISEKIISHKKIIENKKFRFKKFLDVQFISWQREISLKSNADKNSIILTNQAICVGGGLVRSNAYFFYGIDSCLFSGSGDTKEKNSPPSYKESNIPLWGIKNSILSGLKTSSAGAEIGLKLSSLLNFQELQNPTNSGYKLKQDNQNLFFTSLFIKIPLDNFIVQSEIGFFLDQDSTYFSVGFGRKF